MSAATMTLPDASRCMPGVHRMPQPASRRVDATIGAQPKRPLLPGEGRLTFARVDGATALVGCAAASPLQILSPRRRGASAWAVLSNHGGGLVSGDRIALSVVVETGAVALVTSQAEGKVYRSRAAVAEQALDARVAAGGVLAWIPEPVSCFAGSRYLQKQRFVLEDGASLLFFDAVTAGRSARGERWNLDHYESRSEVRASGGLLLRDAIRLDPSSGPPAERMCRLRVIALVVAVGSAFAGFASRLLGEISAAPAERRPPLLVAASPLADGLLMRAGAERVEDLVAFLRTQLSFLSTTLGEDPFACKW